ncbi:MAG: class I SAM-dependent methyltransferase, partial [Elusimicrobia bacterium]|nr:class I SAM-dependent methyltransferase [Elusimicrobiota bacterium]
MKQWLDKDGERFLTKIGIGKGQTVVDFGCGEGNISVPAAKAVGSGGKIYSLDKDSGVLRSLVRKAEKFKLKNIETIEMKNLQIPLPDGVADAVLLYDVLHYLNSADRKKVYVESFR